MKRNKGFSLVELLVSIAILAIIMVMVVQFMGTASVSLRKTRKNMDLQTGAMEFREQFSDVMMQATYVKIVTKDNKKYELDTSLTTSGKKKRKRVDSSSTVTASELVAGETSLNLVSDNYPSYCKAGSKDMNIYINENFTLVGKDDSTTVTAGNDIRSLRILSDGATGGKSYYVKPEYIYIRYQPTYETDAVAGTTTNKISSESYVLYHFNGKRVYMYEGNVSNPLTSTDDGFSTAKTELTTYTGENASVDDYAGLMLDLVNEVFISVDTTTNTFRINAQLYDSDQPKSRRGTTEDDSAFTKYIYDYEDSIVFRNANALTVAPNKLYKRKVVTTTP